MQEIEDWGEIQEKLMEYHSIFNKFAGLGLPIETDAIPTCAVSFDSAGQTVQWMVNPTFWKSLSEEGKLFAVSHECLHVLFSHGIRMNAYDKKVPHDKLNIAADIVVNDYLRDRFDFKKEEVQPEGIQYIWREDVLPQSKAGGNFEYYVAQLGGMTDKQVQKALGDAQTVDDHSGLDSFAGPGLEEMIERHMDVGDKKDIKDVSQDDTNPAIEQAMKMVEKGQDPTGNLPNPANPYGMTSGKLAGTGPGDLICVISSKKKIQRKKKWETLVKKYTDLAYGESEIDGWIMPNKKINEEYIKDLNLPTPYESDVLSPQRVKVAFFLDTSGSCWHLAERFFNACASIDPRKFEVDLLLFDTSVYRTDLKTRKMYGGGGTSFSILERFLQKEKNEGKPYPKVVFCITDGYGDKLNVEHPNRWHFFLTEDNTTDCLPAGSHFHELVKFE